MGLAGKPKVKSEETTIESQIKYQDATLSKNIKNVHPTIISKKQEYHYMGSKIMSFKKIITFSRKSGNIGKSWPQTTM